MIPWNETAFRANAVVASLGKREILRVIDAIEGDIAGVHDDIRPGRVQMGADALKIGLELAEALTQMGVGDLGQAQDRGHRKNS